MAICNNCGVELEEGLVACPLCGKSTGIEEESNISAGNSPSEILTRYRKENRRHLWELTGIIAFSGITACTVIDLLAGKGLSWSLYTGISLICTWIFLTLILLCSSRPLLIIGGMMSDMILLLAVIDILSPGKPWFLPVGLPVTLAVSGSAAALTALFRKAGIKGLNLIGAGFLFAALICIVTEISLDLHTGGTVHLRWSAYTAVSVLPVSLILFYYHYRLKKGNRLDSLFHI